MELYSDEYFMNEALKEARKAFDADEVPVGAVIVIVPVAKTQVGCFRLIVGAAGVGGQPDDVAGIRRDFGFDQDDVKHGGYCRLNQIGL